MQDPLNPAPTPSTPSPPPAESVEDQWKELPGSQSLKLLHAEDFDSHIAESVQTLVMFYAPCESQLIVYPLCLKVSPILAIDARMIQ